MTDNNREDLLRTLCEQHMPNDWLVEALWQLVRRQDVVIADYRKSAESSYYDDVLSQR